MQQASLSQRQVGQAAVAAAVQRAQRFVDRTLRLSNLSTLSAYVFGQGPLPVSKSFQVTPHLRICQGVFGICFEVSEPSSAVCWVPGRQWCGFVQKQVPSHYCTHVRV